MKKFVRVVFILIIVLIVLGGALLGGVYVAHEINPDSDAFDKTETFTVKFDGQDIKSINAESSYAGIKLVKGSSWDVRFEDVFKDYASAHVEGDTLVINATTKKDINLMEWRLGTVFEPGRETEPMIYITYPEGTEFEDIDIQLGTGKVIIKDVKAENIICQSFLGTIDIERCRFTKKSAFQLLFGSLKADDVMFRNSNIDIFAGLCKIKLDETSRKADIDIKITLGFSDFN